VPLLPIQQREAPPLTLAPPSPPPQLYFTGVPTGVLRETILKLFSQHGRVRHLQLYADDLGALTSGTVTMFSRNEAVTAMAALDGVALVPGVAPLKVAWAQLNVAPKAQQTEVPGATVAYCSLPPAVTPHEVGGAGREGNGLARPEDLPRPCVTDSVPAPVCRAGHLAVTSAVEWRASHGRCAAPWCCLLPAPVPWGTDAASPTAHTAHTPPAPTPQPLCQVAALLQRFGPVLKVIPFPARREGPPGTRGCGRVIMSHPAHAEAAVGALGGKFVWPGAEWPFQVQPYTPPSLAGGGSAAAAAAAGPSAPRGSGAAGTAAAAAAAAAAAGALQAAGEPGAAAMTLTNLPPQVDESELRGLLSSYGRVARLDLAKPPGAAGGAPGGPGAAARVWYASRAEAEAAAAALSGALLRSAGEEPRRLQVAATTATPSRAGAGDAGMPSGALLVAGASQGLQGAAALGLGGAARTIGLAGPQGGAAGDASWALPGAFALQALGQNYLDSLLRAGGLGPQDTGAHTPWPQQQQPQQQQQAALFNQQWQQQQLAAPAQQQPVGPSASAPFDSLWGGPLTAAAPPQAPPALGQGLGLSGTLQGAPAQAGAQLGSFGLRAASSFGSLSSAAVPAATPPAAASPSAAATPPAAAEGLPTGGAAGLGPVGHEAAADAAAIDRPKGSPRALPLPAAQLAEPAAAAASLELVTEGAAAAMGAAAGRAAGAGGTAAKEQQHAPPASGGDAQSA
jgi:hypothetical protein